MQKKCCVVGIAGGSASGKTTLAHALKHFLEEQQPPIHTELLSADAFYRTDRTQGPSFVLSHGEEHFNFNHPDALDCERLLNHIISRSTAESAAQVLLVEGIMVLHLPELREHLDLRLFIELESDVRALRRLLRDMKGGRGRTDAEWIAAYYLESAKVGHELFVEPSRIHADFIVRGDANFSRLLPLLSASINSM